MITFAPFVFKDLEISFPKRPLPPNEVARSKMMLPIDIAKAILLCASMPQRTLVQDIIMKPTFDRDMTEDFQVARNLGKPTNI